MRTIEVIDGVEYLRVRCKTPYGDSITWLRMEDMQPEQLTATISGKDLRYMLNRGRNSNDFDEMICPV